MRRGWWWTGKVLAALFLVVLIAGCGSTQQPPAAHKPSPTPSPAPTPCPVQAAAGVWVRGCAILDDGDNIDLDGGQVDVSSFDLGFANGQLTVAPGTEAAYLGARDFGSLGPSDIGGANLGTSAFSLDQLQKGGVLAVRTGQGRPCKVQVDTVSAKTLNLSFFTYSSFAVTATTPTPFHNQPTPTPTHTHTTSPSSSPEPPSASPSA